MMKITYSILVLYCMNVYCLGAEGDACLHAGLPGVCKPFGQCDHAQLLVRRRKKPTTCFYDDNGVRVVCCVQTTVAPTMSPTVIPTVAPTITPTSAPTKSPTVARTITLTANREALNYTVLRFENKECIIKGTFPITCVSEVDFKDLGIVEPHRCPKLPALRSQERPILSPYETVISDACYEYSRLASKCLESGDSPGRYIRDRCSERMLTTKITGGEPASPQEFPHMAVLGSFKENNSQEYDWFGGGSLISEYFILTAAHVRYKPGVGIVKFALMGIIDKTNISSGLLYYIREIFRYPHYNETTMINDIALLKLDKRVLFTEFIRPACLQFPGLQVFSVRIIAGWGLIEKNRSKMSDLLLKAIIYEQPHSKCETHLHRRYFKWDRNTMVCAGGDELDLFQESCTGDSGGPLMARIKSVPCSLVVMGIASQGHGCGVGFPGAYTNASHPEYLEWIVGHVWPRQLKKQLTILQSPT